MLGLRLALRGGHGGGDGVSHPPRVAGTGAPEAGNESTVQTLFELRRGEPGSPPADESLLDIRDGLRTQLAVLARFLDAGDGLAGYKIGWTSGDARTKAHENGVRPFGYILASHVFESGPSLELAPIRSCRLEPEICLTLGQDLEGRHVTSDDAWRAVQSVAPAFEINEFRLDDGSPVPLVVADGLRQWGIVVGEGRPVDSVDVMRTRVEVWSDESKVSERSAEGYLDDPFVSLSRLTALLAEFDVGLQAGQRIITGSLSQHPIQGPGSWSADFSTMGTVAVRFWERD